MRCEVVALCIVMLSCFAQTALAGEYTVFGPQTFERETGKPFAEVVSFESPVIGDDFTLKGYCGEEKGKGRVSSGKIRLNRKDVALPSDFNQQVAGIERTVPLGASNEISVKLAGKPGSNITFKITGVDNTPPQVVIDEPADGLVTEAKSVDVSGSVVDNTPTTVSVNGVSVDLEGESFTLAGLALEIGENTITVSATDMGGNTSTASVIITRQPPRPKVEPQPEGSYGAQYKDLIPADATKESYDPKRFSLITGEVQDLQKKPISDVTVSVGANSCNRCHGNEYGTVKTDTEGRFTIPVEGGTTMTVVYKKNGLITSHRQVYVPWNDFAITDTIQMIPIDSRATTVTFDGNPDTVVTHRSTEIADEFGARAATLVFSGDNKAYEVDGEGNVIRELPSITTRATEFVTPESMPAHLPPTSAYTYCSEFSVDGVERVRFEKPVIGWVDNFLGFDVGEIVPVGYYDRDRGVWVPSDNGVVVMLLDTDGDGVVDALDSDGDNIPNDLNGNGNFSDEVRGLGDSSRYRSGDTFWRFGVTHFTPWDCNWPYGPPRDATAPNPKGKPKADTQLANSHDDKDCINSYVESRSRIFHEDIPIPGTDMTLHYSSQRTRDSKVKIVVPISGDRVPDSLESIIVELKIAGRIFHRTYPPQPNQKAVFPWGGVDLLGNPVSGRIPAHVDIGFEYQAVYYSASSLVSSSFAAVGENVTGVRGRTTFVSWIGEDFDLHVNPKRFAGKTERGFPQGWSISNHHYNDPKDPGTLYKGDGTTSQNSSLVIAPVAGHEYLRDDNFFYLRDMPAAEVALNGPEDIATDASGNMYIADGRYIRKVDSAGNISTIAGHYIKRLPWERLRNGVKAEENDLGHPFSLCVDDEGNIYVGVYHQMSTGQQTLIRKIGIDGKVYNIAGGYSSKTYGGFSGDGGFALLADITFPTAITVDRWGNVYFADYWNHRIRKIDTNGIITTVAGSGPTGRGNDGFAGDGGPATKARLAYPSGIAVDQEGNLFIADKGNHRIRKVDTSGIITTIAGTGVGGFSGDGGPATSAQLASPVNIKIDNNDNLFFPDWGNRRVRKIDSHGIITTVAFNGDYPPRVDDPNYSYAHKIYDGVPALTASGSPESVAVDPAGAFYIAEDRSDRDLIYKVSTLDTFEKIQADGERSFVERTGQAYVMSEAGIHRRTIDLDTGQSLLEFDYDTLGNLRTVIDRFGSLLSIERDAAGKPIAIVSPAGLRTELTIDDSNNLTRVTYPDGSYYRFECTPAGLMTAEIDPNGNRFDHSFDLWGRIADVSDPEGGSWNYSRTENSNGDVLVRQTTAEGNVTKYVDHSELGGDTVSTITGPAGGTTTVKRAADGMREVTPLSCGMQVERKYDLDPEYRYKYVNELRESTPSGRVRVTRAGRSYPTEEDGSDSGDAGGLPEGPIRLLEVGFGDPLLGDVGGVTGEIPGDESNEDSSANSGLITETVSVNGKVSTLTTDTVQAKKEVTSPQGRKVTSRYDPTTLLTSRLSVAGLHDVDYTYDTRGRLTSLTQGERQSAFAYTDKGFLASVTDPENRTTTYDHDLMGRVTAIHRPDGSTIGFTYDNNGNMTVLANPSSVNHDFGYNGVDKKTSYQTPLSGSYQYLYDRDRRLTDTIFPSGKRISNIYTNTQLTQIQTPEGDIDLDYLCSSKLGSMTNGSEKLAYDYDGKLLTSETLVGTLNQSLSYTYNNDFNVTAFTYAGGTVNYAYDNDGLLTGAGGFTIARNAGNGLPESVTDGDFSLSRTFNGYGEIAGEATAVGGGERYAYSLTRNASGRITGKTENAAGEAADYSYTYDDLGRLRTVTKDSALVEEYRYDVNGRRSYEMNALRGIAGRTLTYSYEDHLLSAGDVTYQYDLDGFLTSKTQGTETTSYNYSSRGELLSVTLPDGKVIEYVHDPQGRRIAKKVNGVIVEKYLWQGLTRLLAVYDGSDNLLMRFQYADGRIPVAMTKGGATYYLAYDQLGTLRLVTDAAGNVVKKVDYDSFGNILADSNADFTVFLGFAGGFCDRDTGLVRFGFRDYDPEIGRWTAKDPIGFIGGDLDLFEYVQNDPINYTDPSGLVKWTGTSTQYAATGGPGGTYVKYGLTSEWVNNKRATVTVLAAGPAVGLKGASGASSDVEFHDYNNHISPDSFNGAFAIVQANLGVFTVGKSVSKTTLGDVYSDGKLSFSSYKGIESSPWGALFSLGTSTLWETNWETRKPCE